MSFSSTSDCFLKALSYNLLKYGISFSFKKVAFSASVICLNLSFSANAPIALKMYAKTIPITIVPQK